MRVLFDTHLLIWIAGVSDRVPQAVKTIANDPRTELVFNVASIWEIAIKRSQERGDFRIEPVVLRQQLLDHGYSELPVLGEHANAVATLPWIHRDPFDRLLVAQAIVEGLDLLTVDRRLALYQGPVRCF